MSVTVESRGKQVAMCAATWYRARMLIRIAIAMSLFAACGDDPDPRLAPNCGDSVCETGLCADSVCLDPAGDDDADGLTNAVEFALGSNVFAPDSDGDGLLDGDEVETIAGVLEGVDSDGDGRLDIVESNVADADDDCVPDQRDAEDTVPNADASPILDVVCSLEGVCAEHRMHLRVSCASGQAACVYDDVPGFADPEVACDGLDDNCDGTVDEAFPDGCVNDPDYDADGIADASDVCPSVADPAQVDGDGDGIGDLCASHYAFVFDAPMTDVVVGVPFDVSVSLSELDGADAPLPTFKGEVALSLGSEGDTAAELLGTLVQAAGVTATFTALVITQPGLDFVLVTSAGSLEHGTSAVFAAATDDVHCVGDDNCGSGICREGLCVSAQCDDGVANGGESGIDCGGVSSCGRCETGLGCEADGDCASAVCDVEVGQCAAPGCDDGVTNGGESGIDCGGTSGCDLCDAGFGCTRAADCASGVCDPADDLCAAPACDDGVTNGTESGLDCGGTSSCGLCDTGLGCMRGEDCVSGVCAADEAVCLAPSCDDGVANGGESGVDCGGDSSCGRCDVGAACGAPGDCVSGVCSGDVCAQPSCSDAVANGVESGVDCGGGSQCPRCGTGGACAVAADCASGVCSDDVCAAPACDDGVLNGAEAEVDCGGGSSCGACAVVCDGPEDCDEAACVDLPLCSLVGTWDFETVSGTAYITFLANGTYVHAEHSNSDTNGQNGIEVGTYTWTRATGAFATTCPTVDTNREWGMSHGGGGLTCANGGSGTRATVVLTGDTLTFTIAGEGSFDAARLVGPSALVGTWRPEGGDGSPFLTFAADGTYVHAEYGTADPNGQPGLEAGSYTWNDATGAFVSTCPPIDTNGQWGLSHPNGQTCTGSTGTFTVDGDVLTVTFGAETFTATRVVAVAP